MRPSKGLMRHAWEIRLAHELKKSARLYFMPITNPRAAWKILRKMFTK